MALKKLIAFFLLGLIQSSYQQVWKNNKIVWGQPQLENSMPSLTNEQSGDNFGLGSLIGYNFQQQQPNSNEQNERKNILVQNAPSFFYPHPSPIEIPAQPPKPLNFAPSQQYQPSNVGPAQQYQPSNVAPAQPPKPSNVAPAQQYQPSNVAPAQQYQPSNVAPAQPPKPSNVAPAQQYQPSNVVQPQQSGPQPVLTDKAPSAKPEQSGPYDIKHETLTSSGLKIIENLIGGVAYNCDGKPTGHFRDSHFCDVFHACVFGQQQKTYACPFVGEAQYFDEESRKCEFVRSNPEGCSSKVFFH